MNSTEAIAEIKRILDDAEFFGDEIDEFTLADIRDLISQAEEDDG